MKTIITVLLLSMFFNCLAQEETKDEEFPYSESIDYDHDGDVDEGDLARAAQNPVGDLISLPFQNNTSFGIGPNDRIFNLYIQSKLDLIGT